MDLCEEKKCNEFMCTRISAENDVLNLCSNLCEFGGTENTQQCVYSEERNFPACTLQFSTVNDFFVTGESDLEKNKGRNKQKFNWDEKSQS